MKLALLLLFPLLELYVLVKLSAFISGLGVVALVFLAVVFGMWLIREYGSQSLGRMQAELAAGRMPEEVIFENIMIFLAGILFVFPGVITDCIAILLLIPFTRQFLSVYVTRYITKRQQRGQSSFFSGGKTFFYSGSTSGDIFNKAQQAKKAEDVVFDCVIDEPKTPNQKNDKKSEVIVIDCVVEDDEKH